MKRSIYLFLIVVLTGCAKEPEMYYGASYTFNGGDYLIPQTYCSITRSDTLAQLSNVEIKVNTPSGYMPFFAIDARAIGTNSYMFTDSAITFLTTGDFFIQNPAYNYDQDRYTQSIGSITYHNLDTNDFHCSFNYQFLYYDLTNPSDTFRIQINDAEIRVKK